jgi:hypothetical protein
VQQCPVPKARHRLPLEPRAGLERVETGPAWARRETIETTLSAFGAGFVGLGVGLVLGVQDTVIGWTLLIGGILSHSLGMVFLHRRRQGHGDEQPKWLEYAYWTCWVVLLVVIGLVLWLALR